MGNRLTLPLLLVAALLAGGAFFWLDDGGRRDERGESAPAAAASSDTPVSTELQGAQRPTEVAPAVAEGRRTEVEVPTPAPAATRSAGGTRVVGSVTDTAGRPVAGARVRGLASGGLSGLDLAGDLDWLKDHEAETDEAGQFVLEDVEPGVLRLSVRSSGFAPFRRDKVGIPSEPEVRLDPCTLQPGAILSGLVVDVGGRGVPGVEIFPQSTGSMELVLGTERSPLTVTDATGAFRIDEQAIGPWRFLVHSPDHPDRIESGSTDRNTAVVSNLRWELAPGARIEGRVTGLPAGSTEQLEVRAARQGERFEFADPDSFVGASRVADVDRSGRFELRGLEVGTRYELQARRKREKGHFDFWERSRSSSVQATAGDSGVLLPYQPEGAVLLTVVDAQSGAPVEKMQVEAGISWPAALRDEDGRPRTFFPEGRVRAGGLRPDGDDERVTLVLKATGYREFRRDDIALRAGQELDLGLLRLEPVPVLRVQVLDAARGEPIVGATVRMQRDLGDSQSVRRQIEFTTDGVNQAIEVGEGRSGVTDEEGWAEITSFEGETVSLVARAKGYAPNEEGGIHLPEGQRVEHVLRLGLGGDVRVQVVDARGAPVVGARVSHREPGAPDVFFPGMGGDHVSDSQGVVLFETLQPGLHSFRIDEGGRGGAFFAGEDQVVLSGIGSDAGADWSEVQVTEGGRAELRLVAAPRGELTGRIREGGQPLAGARVELREPDAHADPMGFLGGGGGPQATSDASGVYRLEDVKAGRYLAAISHPDRQMTEEREVVVREGDNAFDVDLPLSVVEGRVTSQEGAPLAGIRVRPERAAPEGEGRQTRMALFVLDDGAGGSVIQGGEAGKPVLTDAEGRYQLRGVLSGVDLLVKAEGDTVQPGQSETFEVAADQVRRNVDLVLEEGGAIDVVAEAADGSPARMCFVQASYGGEDATDVQPKFSFIQSGSTVLRGLKPGPWKLSLRRAGPGNHDDPPKEQVIEVQVGETAEASFRLD